MKASKKTSQNAQSQVPKFSTLEEERAFWATHSIADFPEEWTAADESIELTPALEGKIRSRRGQKHLFPVYLEPGQWDKVQKVAQKKQVSPETLVRRWIEEKLVS
jgi:hypothetical protein